MAEYCSVKTLNQKLRNEGRVIFGTQQGLCADCKLGETDLMSLKARAPITSPASLRDRLRQDTAERHRALDDQVSRFDLTDPVGLGQFLMMQSLALRGLGTLGAGLHSRAMIRELEGRVARDLASLQLNPPPLRVRLPDAISDLAVDYVVCGSRLGTQVLKRRWSESKDPQVMAACHYFTAPSYIEHWQKFCAQAGLLRGTDKRAERVIYVSNTVFDFYGQCALQALEPSEHPHVR